ncbi:inovirus-type Gp2 protein [Thiomicrorhabdus indica]|uniref:YagK/YfjJ domain-containing protein n=1 Tax=Thiomicrorhabdus indica TaxID=2267253 RepID=UPI002AA865FF|nr:inovirus-type Gp2 protein [Thiomicrorhabdus indica]
MTTAYQQVNQYPNAYQGLPKRHPENKELTLWYGSTYSNAEIQTAKGPMVKEYLDGLIETYKKHSQQYSKRFVVIVHLNFPPHSSLEQRVQQDYFKRFMASLNSQIDAHAERKRAQGDGRTNKIRFCRVYEDGQNRGLHLHAVLFFNGHSFRALGDFNSTQNNLYHRIVAAWASALGLYPCQLIQEGLIDLSHGGYFIDSGAASSKSVVLEMFKHYSYICKAYSKRYDLPVKIFSRSRG